MAHLIQWQLLVPQPPALSRHCRHCGAQRLFHSSGLFRVNANHHRLDVWLIYRCEACEASWKLTLHERVLPRALNPDLYAGYLQNDDALARQCAFDSALLARAGATPDWAGLAFSVEGPAIDPARLTEAVTVQITCDVPAPLRLEKLLREKLGLSASALKRLVETGRIDCGGDPRRLRFHPGITVRLLP